MSDLADPPTRDIADAHTQKPGLAGRTYREVIAAYEDSTVMGIMRGSDGAVLINPPMDTAFSIDDQVIAITEDDDTLVLRADAGGGLPDAGALSHRPRLPPAGCCHS